METEHEPQGDPDEFQVPDAHPCGDCGTPWSEHQLGSNGVTSPTGCPAFFYVPPGWS